MRSTLLSRACAALLVCLPLTAAHADVLIDNLGEPVKNPAPLNPAFWYAQSFLTPGGGDLRLDLATARVGLSFGDPGIVAELRADAGGLPGSVLTTFTIPTGIVGTATLNTGFAPTNAVTLTPESTYWLLLGVTGGGGFTWDYALGNGASGSGSFFNYAYTVDQGASWTGIGAEDPMMMRIDVTPVPEPATALIFAAGLLGLALRRLREGPGAER